MTTEITTSIGNEISRRLKENEVTHLYFASRDNTSSLAKIIFNIPVFNADKAIIETLQENPEEGLKKLKKAYVKYLQNELTREDLKEND